VKRPWLGPLRSAWESIRASYWFLPSLMAATAAVLAFGMLEVDRRGAASWLREVSWIREVGAEGTRAVLGTIAGSIITVTGVVFSITIVALTLASSQFGPRLLRTFLRDRHNQLVLGTFVATFLYVLLVLRAVREGHVPQLATAGAAALAVISVFVLIYFIHHAASSIQVSSVIAAVADEIEQQMPLLFPEQAAHPEHELEPDDATRLEALARDAREVEACASGYVRVLDVDTLVALAAEQDLLIRLCRRPGDFVQTGQVVARVAPASRAADDLCGAIRESFVLGNERTAVQDLAFLTDQLAEVAVRALSPGVNDPGTAVACVRRLGHVVATLAQREMPDERVLDDEERLRVLVTPTRFDEIVAGCLDPVRRYGAKDATVAVALLEAVSSALRCARDPERRRVLLEHAFEIHDAFAAEAPPAKRDAAAVQAALAEATAAAAERIA